MGVARTLAGYETLGDYHLIDTVTQRLAGRDGGATCSGWRGNICALPPASLLEYLPKDSAVTVPERSRDEMQSELYWRNCRRKKRKRRKIPPRRP